MNQGKSHKVAATQENTAQNSANQSRAFGLFTDQELTNIVNNSGNALVLPSFLINYLHQAEKVLDRARISDDNRNFIKGAFAMLCAFGNWDTRAHYEYMAQNDSPEDIRCMLEEGEEAREDIADCIRYEMWTVLNDIQDDEWFVPENELDNALEALEGYLDVVHEYELEDLLGQDILTETEKVLNQ
jgi:hypothetical protein